MGVYFLRTWMLAILIGIAASHHVQAPLSTLHCPPNEQHTDGEATEKDCATLNILLLRSWNDLREGVGEFVSRNRDDIAALSGAAVALFTGTLWWVTWGLVRIADQQRADTLRSISAAERSAKVAEDALLIVERPHMFVTDATFDPVIERETFDWTGPEIWPWITFMVENHGKTPALVIEVCADSICAPALPSDVTYRPNTTYDEMRYVFAAGEARGLEFLFKTPLNGETLNNIAIGPMNGGRRLWAYGYIKYTDIFNTTNTVGFCWRYNLDLKRFLPDDTAGYTYRRLGETGTGQSA